MRVPSLFASLSIAAAVLLSACGDSNGESKDDGNSPPEKTYDWTQLDTALDSFLGSDADQVTGYSFALNVDGKTVHTRSGGVATSDVAIPIASASKAPSATVILSLVDEGKIDLDTPIADYIGNDIDWPIAKRTITLRMLLNHTSGLPFESDCMDTDDTTLKACAEEIGSLDLNFVPGTQFGYSGAGYQVAGYLAEKVSGKSWAELVKEHLSDPLGMSTFNYGDSNNPRIGGGAICNASDYLKFTQMWLNGGKAGGKQLVSATHVTEAKSSQITGLPVFFTPVPDGSGLHGYSFGWWISDAAKHPDSNGPELSDPGILGTTPWLDYDRKYTAIVLIASTTDVGLAMWDAARPEIMEQLDQ